MTEINYRAIRRRIILRWLNRILFAVNLLLFIAYVSHRSANGYLSGYLKVIWLVVLVTHGVFALKDVWPFSLIGDLLQHQTEREAARLRARGYVVKPPEHMSPPETREKPKRAARLSDDGEIEYEDEAFDNVPARRSRAHERD